MAHWCLFALVLCFVFQVVVVRNEFGLGRTSMFSFLFLVVAILNLRHFDSYSLAFRLAPRDVALLCQVLVCFLTINFEARLTDGRFVMSASSERLEWMREYVMCGLL